MKYRSKIDLIAQMLQVASEGPVLKTKMMYGALLSQSQLKGLLSLTLNAALLAHNKEDRLTRLHRRVCASWKDTVNYPIY